MASMTRAARRTRPSNHGCQIAVIAATTASYVDFARGTSPSRAASRISWAAACTARAPSSRHIGRSARSSADRSSPRATRTTARRPANIARAIGGGLLAERSVIVMTSSQSPRVSSTQVRCQRAPDAYGAHSTPAASARSTELRNQRSASSSSPQSWKERARR